MLGRFTAYVKSVSASSPFLRHVLTLMTGTAISQIIVFFMTMVLTRMFSSATWGEAGTFTSLAAMLIAMGAGRYDLAIMLERDDGAAKQVARLAFRCIIGVSIFGVIAGFALRPLAAKHYTEGVATWLPLIGVSAFFMAGATMLQFWFNRKTDYKTIARNRVLQQVGMSGGQLGFGLAGILTLPGLIFGQIIGQAFAFVNLGRKATDLRTISTEGAPSIKQLAKKHWKMPVLNGPNVFVDTIRSNGIILLIGLISLPQLGQYLVAYRTVQVPVTLINSAVSQVFFQKLSRIEPGKMTREVVRSIKRAIAIGTLPFVVLWIVSPWLFPIVFGSEWQMAGHYARALIPWLCMLLITSPISQMFVVTGTQHWVLAHSIFYTVVPLSWLKWSPYNDLLPTVQVLGLLMAGCLILLTVIAVFAAKRYDRRGVTESTT
ncbi:MAG: oligosaccharide flippase family protein [Flaviflexus sp.]|nr:oligosaccharide flippase family protein [Flaviflexus sp.]